MKNHASELNSDFYTHVVSPSSTKFCATIENVQCKFTWERVILTASESMTKKRKYMKKKQENKKIVKTWPRRTMKGSNQSNKYGEFKIINV